MLASDVAACLLCFVSCTVPSEGWREGAEERKKKGEKRNKEKKTSADLEMLFTVVTMMNRHRDGGWVNPVLVRIAHTLACSCRSFYLRIWIHISRPSRLQHMHTLGGGRVTSLLWRLVAYLFLGLTGHMRLRMRVGVLMAVISSALLILLVPGVSSLWMATWHVRALQMERSLAF